MNKIPTLTTPRLILRPFRLTDARDVQQLAGDYDIAATTIAIPHPYENGMAEDWIKTHSSDFENGTQVVFAITHREKKFLIGAIGISNIKHDFEIGELGYWIGKKYWNNGYGTEAADVVIKYGIEELSLNRIYAHHFKNNHASGRILQKVGMKHEGSFRQHVKKWGNYIDVEAYGIVKSDLS
jgi:ribosomal-protein-alanine N-acetyltransferase